MEKTEKLFLKPGDGLVEVMKTLARVKGGRLTLHVPKDSALASLEQFHALKREAAIEGVEIIVVSADRRIEELAHSARLATQNPGFGKDERLVVDIIRRKEPEEAPSRQAGPSHPNLKETDKVLPRMPRRTPRERALAIPPSRWLVAAAVVLVLGGVGVFGATRLPRAEVRVGLERTTVAFTKNIVVRTDAAAVAIEGDKLTLPGEFLKASRTIEESFPASGTAEVSEKAKGELYVYNDYAPASQMLVEKTRFVSPGGLVYRLDERVTVPPKGADGTPGRVKVRVTADASGEKHNITSGDNERWTLPGFQEAGLTERYKGFYGVPVGKMSGGFIGERTVLTDADTDAAREELSAMLQGALLHEMRVTDAPGYVALKEAQVFSLTSFSPLPSSSTDSLGVVASGELKRIAYREEDLLKALLEAVSSPVDYDADMVDVHVGYENVSADWETGTLTFVAQGNFTAVPKVDETVLKSQLAGLGQADVTSALLSVPGLMEAKVRLWPRWTDTLPRDVSRIKLTFE